MTKIEVREAYVAIESKIRNAKIFGKNVNPMDQKQMIIAAYQLGVTEQVKEYFEKIGENNE